MIKLYKKENGGFRYREAWEHEGEVTVHWGELGTQGETRTVAVQAGQSAKEAIDNELAQARADGFAEIDSDDHIEFIVQYGVEGHGTEEDLEKRYAVEDLLNGALGWTGNGHCDGGQMGSGSMEVFSYVIDPHIACKTTVESLRENSLLEGALIAYEEDEEYKVLYPENHADEVKFF